MVVYLTLLAFGHSQKSIIFSTLWDIDALCVGPSMMPTITTTITTTITMVTSTTSVVPRNQGSFRLKLLGAALSQQRLQAAMPCCCGNFSASPVAPVRGPRDRKLESLRKREPLSFRHAASKHEFAGTRGECRVDRLGLLFCDDSHCNQVCAVRLLCFVPCPGCFCAPKRQTSEFS